MSFSLSLYLYKRFQEKLQSAFEKNNKILSLADIEHLLIAPNQHKTIRIFKSAVVDHEPVDGIPYHLVPPVPPLFYHDHFKRCLIARAVGELAGRLDMQHSQDAVAILDELRETSSAGYVQVFAWHALGRWAALKPGLWQERCQDMIEAFGGATATLLGAVLFLDQVRTVTSRAEVLSLIEEGQKRVKYKVQKALFGYFLIRNGYDDAPYRARHFTDQNMQIFLKQCAKSNGTSRAYFEEGIREIGLVSGYQNRGLQAGTQQADMAYHMEKMGGDYLSAIGLYLRICWH
ncbi:MAG: hypothetical protein KC618_01665 [Candidatus Omnitrophica bacterium]|nr:hypothetical protein [Candidatus Omnitrophota bacterium]